MSTNIPKQVTIGSLIRMLEIFKQEVGGEELVLFRGENGDIYANISNYSN